MKQRPRRYRSIVRAVYETPWAILPEKLDAMCELLNLRSAGRIFSAAEVAARIGTKPPPAQGTPRVAVLNVFGVLAQRMGLMEEVSGGVSTEAIGRAFDAAAADPNVTAIAFNFDTPGGSTFGIQELAAKIARGAGDKKVIGCVNSLCASGGYWLASACDEIWITDSGMVGSIGVLSLHVSTSGADEKDGIKTTIMRAPEGKAEGTAGEPLSDSAVAHRQAIVDAVYADFVGDVARYRGASVAKVKSDYGRGRMLMAKDALAAGMVDRIGTFESLLSTLGVGSQASGTTAHAQEPAFSAEWLT